MADFNTSYKITAKIEGGYANDTHDSGGETWRGIARNSNPSWDGWKIIDDSKKKNNFPKNLEDNNDLQNKVLSLYKSNYWSPLQLDGIALQKVADELYDTAVNMGVTTSAMFFQKSLNVLTNTNIAVDGKVGKGTMTVYNSLSQSDQNNLFKLLNILQGEKYINICQNNPSQKKFIRGWLTRVIF